jgi:hypothetical protein
MHGPRAPGILCLCCIGTLLVCSMPDWKDDIVHWARRNEGIWELWLLSQNAEANDALTIGVALAPADGYHSRALGDFSLLDARWRSELRTITRRQVRLEPMVPGYPGDTTIRSAGTCLWKR